MVAFGVVDHRRPLSGWWPLGSDTTPRPSSAAPRVSEGLTIVVETAKQNDLLSLLVVREVMPVAGSRIPLWCILRHHLRGEHGQHQHQLDAAFKPDDEPKSTASTSAAVVDRELFLRGEQYLYCIAEG